MKKIQENTFQNAAGKIDYTLMNDYMFRAVLQENKNVLRGLICALLHLSPKTVKSTVIMNPIEIGKEFDGKTFVLDVKVLLNDEKIINLEMQVVNQEFWTNRSLSYLCSIFQNLESGEDYSQIKPACHIGILDFSPFPDYPEFYAINKMMNVKKHYIYNDNFTLNVLDLGCISHSKLCDIQPSRYSSNIHASVVTWLITRGNQVELATKEDKEYRIDYWAKLFKAKTWEDKSPEVIKDAGTEK